MKKKIFITGGHGFLGKQVYLKLKKSGYNNIIRPTKKKCNLILEKDIIKIFKENKNIDTVIHLASVHGGLYYNINNKGSIYYKNILMNTKLMHYAMLNNVKKFISAGTVDCYPKKTPFPLKEKFIWDGYPEETSAPYAFSKKMMIVQGQAYKEQFKFNHKHLLFMNLYGPGDNFDIKNSHVIPAIIKKIYLAKKNKKKHITLFGSGNQKREFLFITDAAIAIVKSVKRNTQSPLINIGTGKAYDIKFIAKTIAKLMSYRGKIIWDTKINSGILKKNFNINKAKKELKFLPKIKIEEGLKKTIIFFRKKND